MTPPIDIYIIMNSLTNHNIEFEMTDEYIIIHLGPSSYMKITVHRSIITIAYSILRDNMFLDKCVVKARNLNDMIFEVYDIMNSYNDFIQ